MTVDEWRSILATLTPEQRTSLRSKFGGQGSEVEDFVQQFAYADNPPLYERILVFRLRQLGISGVMTEDEKLVTSALTTADASKKSASAAERSADAAASSARIATYSVVVAILTVIVSITLSRCPLSP